MEVGYSQRIASGNPHHGPRLKRGLAGGVPVRKAKGESEKRKADPSKTRDDSGFRGGIYFYCGAERVSPPALDLIWLGVPGAYALG